MSCAIIHYKGEHQAQLQVVALYCLILFSHVESYYRSSRRVSTCSLGTLIAGEIESLSQPKDEIVGPASKFRSAEGQSQSIP